jgi:hypothetical protein
VSPGLALREALVQAIAFEAQDAPLGNLSWGRGVLDGRAVRAAFVDNRIASGSIGAAEAERLSALLRVAAAERSPLVLFLDSAGARVSEGLRALGAFRSLYRVALDAVRAGMPFACVLGRNCYGGASMVAMLAAARLFSPETRLAMSGPAIIASTAGTTPADEMFQAMAEAAMSPAARQKVSSRNGVWHEGEDLAPWLREALQPPTDAIAAWRAQHEAMASRFEGASKDIAWEPLRRRDLEKLYDGGYDVRESHGLVTGEGVRGGERRAVLGLVGSAPLGLARAWRLSELAWRHRESPPKRIEILLDCASHAPRLEDERAVLSDFIVDMACSLAGVAASGTRVELVVLGKAGGGVYVALAAPAERIASVYGADIQVLPASAVAAILGAGADAVPSFREYRSAGVADEEIKLGLVPGAA